MSSRSKNSRGKNDMPTVILRLHGNLYGISAEVVREMVAMPKIVSVPEVPSYYRGIINLRGQVMPLLDMRLRLGKESTQVEIQRLLDLMDQREHDHINWLEELEASCREKREFHGQTDPHKCAFGQWYDHFETDNAIMAVVLRKFDEPHKRIHALAEQVTEHIRRGDSEGALLIIEQTRDGDLAQMKTLFAEFKQVIVEETREIALVLSDGDKPVALAVDGIESVELMPEENIEDVPEAVGRTAGELIACVGKRNKDSEFVMILNANGIIHEAARVVGTVGPGG